MSEETEENAVKIDTFPNLNSNRIPLELESVALLLGIPHTVQEIDGLII